MKPTRKQFIKEIADCYEVPAAFVEQASGAIIDSLINNTQPNPGDNMNNRKKIAAAKKAYELDAAGQLWTTPRGARPITQEAVLVIVNGLAYRLETETIKTALTPKPKRTTKKKEQ